MTQNKNMPEEKEAEMATLGCVFLEPKNSIILLQDNGACHRFCCAFVIQYMLIYL